MKITTRNVVAGVALSIAATSTQAITVLEPTDSNVNFFMDSDAYTIGVFDQADTDFTNNLNVIMGPSVLLGYGGTVSFSPYPATGGPYTADNGIGTLDLGFTNQFIIALSANGIDGWIADTGVTYSANGDVANLTFLLPPGIPQDCNFLETGCVLDTQGDVIAVDVKISTVPVPAAIWLFGAGLVGLAGFARRRA